MGLCPYEIPKATFYQENTSPFSLPMKRGPADGDAAVHLALLLPPHHPGALQPGSEPAFTSIGCGEVESRNGLWKT